MRVNRRTALAAVVAAVAAIPELTRTTGADETEPQSTDGALGPLCLFAKHLQWLSPTELADLLVEMTGQVSHQLLRQIGDSDLGVPVSLHMEYFDHRRPELIDQCVAAYRNDRKSVRRLVGV